MPDKIEKFLEKVFHRCMEEPTKCFDVDCPFSTGEKCEILEYATELKEECSSIAEGK